MEQKNVFVANGFYFVHDFDSGNLGNVEAVPSHHISSSLNYKTNQPETPDFEFNLWTRPDCAGTEFENGNRTWFYFGIVGGQPGALVKLNILNLNKQGKMYSQGMAPVTRILPGKPQWERIKDKPLHWTDDNMFTLSFKYCTSENVKATQFFAFTYPFSFGELQIALNSIDMKFLPLPNSPESLDDIYYHRECLVYSLERRRVDLLTISSYHCITNEREPRLKNLFPEKSELRPFKFNQEKKIVFVSARVHPGETPASFVFNGLLNVLLTKTDPIAAQLRRMYVFKLIPILNPDGVARGHYRTDTRGVNLNRVYLNPSLRLHPTIYGARSIIRYSHFGCEMEDDFDVLDKLSPSKSSQSIQESSPLRQSHSPETKRKQWSVLKNNEINKKDDRVSIKSSGKPQTLSRLNSPKTQKAVSVTTSLIDQVIGIKLQEAKTQTTVQKSSSMADKSSSTLNADQSKNVSLDSMTIRDCLGTELHLTSSDELSKLGTNPLKDLRETLKKSISLLIGSHSYSSTLFGLSAISSNDSANSQSYEMRIGWCPKCTSQMSANDVGLSGVSQKIQTDNKDVKTYEIMFCSNCLKRYAVRNELDQELKVIEPRSSDVTNESAIAKETAYESLDLSPSSEASNNDESQEKVKNKKKLVSRPVNMFGKVLKEPESGLFLYIDLHGHASKKGIFMYGNHFEDIESNVECMLLPRIMSLNNLHFHFSSCNFTEKNMYLRDRRDGMSREGSGRVAVLKATGLVRSYTLECNYNTGRLASPLSPPCPITSQFYTPAIYQEVGKALAASILDLTNSHPTSKIPNSEHRNLAAMRDWLRHHVRTNSIQLTQSRLRPKTTSPARPLFSRTLARCNEKKENTYFGAKNEQGSGTDILRKPKVFQCKTIARCFPEQPPQKARSLLSRPLRRCSNKTSKMTMRTKLSRTRANEAGPAKEKNLKLTCRRSLSLKAATSEDLNNMWRDVYGGKRPRGELNPNHNLKKLRLKSAM